MSLLRQDSPDQLDDAARGESFTRGTSPIVLASIVAAIVVTIVIAAYVKAGQKPPAATGQVLQVWAHPMHTTTPAFDANGVPIPQDTSDQVLVFTRVRLTNQSKIPLFLIHVLANATLADGVHSSYAASASDYDRIFVAYPDLAQWRATPLNTEAMLQPGQTLEGTFVTSFTMSKADWEARKGLDFTVAFRYQPLLNLSPAAPVTER
ncbi:MAG TPA: hypothetical protein VND90_10005 [Terracidiphilus sp.]|nr:hypothetical protein [Terracidiphilus sp.]